MSTADGLTVIENRLDKIIRCAVPGVETVAKYGGTLYTCAPDKKEGQFCGVFAYAEHVQLSFSRGDLLDDPGDFLDGGGKRRRHINFASVDDIPEGDIKRLLQQATGAV